MNWCWDGFVSHVTFERETTRSKISPKKGVNISNKSQVPKKEESATTAAAITTATSKTTTAATSTTTATTKQRRK